MSTQHPQAPGAERPGSERPSMTRWHERWHRRWRRRFRHSLQARLVAVFLMLALATSAVFFVGMQRLVRGGWEVYARPLLEDYATRLAADLGNPPEAARARALAGRLPVRVRIDGPQVQFDSNEAHAVTARSDAPWRRGGGVAWALVRESADGHRITFTLAEPPEAWRERGMTGLVLTALLALTLLAWLAVRRLLAPLEPITRGVEAYGRGDFGRRIGSTPAPSATKRRRPRPRDELGDLADRIDAMADSLHGMLEAKRALLLAISHELRSPLTRARLNAELVTEGPERSALLRDLGEMRELVTSLLESERLAQGHAALQRERTDLAALVREAVAAAAEGAGTGGLAGSLAPRLDIDERLGPVDVDPTRVRLVLRNLLANAWRHAGEAAEPPVVFLRREVDAGGDGRLALGVRDHGPGVAPDVLKQLGEAFHRPDAARTRSAGGVGLGLYLCRLVAEAHGGHLRLRHAEPGLEAAMVWPDRERRA